MEYTRTSHVVGVRYTPTGSVYYCDPGNLGLSVGDRVLVESEGGPREAIVVIAPEQVLYSDLRGALDQALQKLDFETG